MRANGIKWQLFIAFGVLVLVINLFYARLNYLFVEATAGIVATSVIDIELTHLENAWHRDQTLTPSKPYFRIVDQASVDDLGELESIVHERMIFTFGGAELEGYVAPLQFISPETNYLVFKVTEMTTLDAFSHLFNVFLFSVAVAAMILAVLSTWFLSSRLSEPLQRLARSVALQKPESPCSITGTERADEIGQLASAFNDTYAQLQTSWRRERDFASDVSHELRTPISLIKNTLTLNETGVLTSTERQLLDQATGTLQQTVEVLLALARKENLTQSECLFRPVIEKAVLAIIKSHPGSQFNVDLNLSDRLKVFGNPHLLALLCQNLVNNSFYHGDGEQLDVYTKGDEIVFENPLLNNATRQNYQGLGHGQYLVRRIAETMSWGISTTQENMTYRVVLKPKLAL